MATKVVPARYLSISSKGKGKTIAVRNNLGQFEGRDGPESHATKSNPWLKPYHGAGDTTHERHLIKSIDLNNNGRIDPNERGGTVRGRTEKTRVRGSGRSKGYQRSV